MSDFTVVYHLRLTDVKVLGDDGGVAFTLVDPDGQKMLFRTSKFITSQVDITHHDGPPKTASVRLELAAELLPIPGMQSVFRIHIPEGEECS